MNKIKIAVTAAALAVAASGAFAAGESDTTRQERMDQAYSDFKAQQGQAPMARDRMHNPRAGHPMHTGDRADRPSYDKSFGQNMKAAGRNVVEGGKDAGHAVAEGARKTGHAVHKGADKVVNKAKDMTTDKPAP